MKRFKTPYLAVLAILAFPLSAPAAVITGNITGWVESGPLQVIGDGSNSVTLWWSINTTDRGFFYGSGFTGDSDVAVATGVGDIAEIVDASVFAYTSGAVGPVCDADCATNGVGQFLVYNNLNSGYFGALRIDNIIGSGLDATVDLTWWFQTDGSGNFGRPASVPEPGLLGLLGLGLLGMGLARRRRD